jgi:hypothetical protein
VPGIRIPRRLLLAIALAVSTAACSAIPWLPTPQPPLDVPVVTQPAQMRLEVSNGTTIDVQLTVNGRPGIPVVAGQGLDVGVEDVGPVPWSAQVRTMSGRVLVQAAVHAGDVVTQDNSDGSGSMRGVGSRVDLSCGRIDLWSGAPMLGPAPGPGTPGDCDP